MGKKYNKGNAFPFVFCVLDKAENTLLESDKQP
jgi:hypothetical protein